MSEPCPPTRKKKKSEILLSSFQQTKKEKQNSAYVPRRVGGGQVSAGFIKTKKLWGSHPMYQKLKWRVQAKPSQ